MADDRITTGFDELADELRRLPREAAQRLQNVAIANHRDHRKLVIQRSSANFSAEGQRSLRFIVRTIPEGRGKVLVDRIDDVDAGTVSYWKGSVRDPRDGAAARLEKEIGDDTTRPKRRRFLLIPQGDFVTPSGRPRRRSGKPIDIGDLPNTAIIRTRSGKRLLIQHLDAGVAGDSERLAARQRGAPLGRKRSDLGQRSRVVGILVRQARGFQGLDFFGPWRELQSVRDRRFQAILDDIAAGRPLVRSSSA
jgi:hypothetical protein